MFGRGHPARDGWPASCNGAASVPPRGRVTRLRSRYPQDHVASDDQNVHVGTASRWWRRFRRPGGSNDAHWPRSADRVDQHAADAVPLDHDVGSKPSPVSRPAWSSPQLPGQPWSGRRCPGQDVHLEPCWTPIIAATSRTAPARRPGTRRGSRTPASASPTSSRLRTARDRFEQHAEQAQGRIHLARRGSIRHRSTWTRRSPDAARCSAVGTCPIRQAQLGQRPIGPPDDADDEVAGVHAPSSPASARGQRLVAEISRSRPGCPSRRRRGDLDIGPTDADRDGFDQDGSVVSPAGTFYSGRSRDQRLIGVRPSWRISAGDVGGSSVVHRPGHRAVRRRVAHLRRGVRSTGWSQRVHFPRPLRPNLPRPPVDGSAANPAPGDAVAPPPKPRSRQPPVRTAEHHRVAEAIGRAEIDLFTPPWYGGDHLAERAWARARGLQRRRQRVESFPHDHARSRAYRWNEDGMAVSRTSVTSCAWRWPVERRRPDPQGADVRADRPARVDGEDAKGAGGRWTASQPRLAPLALPLSRRHLPVRRPRRGERRRG